MHVFRRLIETKGHWRITLFAIGLLSLGAANAIADEIDIGRIAIFHPWAVPAKAGSTTRMYLLIKNETASPILLMGARTPLAAKTELIVWLAPETSRGLNSISILPGETLNLATSHMWFELTGVKQNLEFGRTFPAELVLNDNVPIPIMVAVDSIGAATPRAHLVSPTTKNIKRTC